MKFKSTYTIEQKEEAAWVCAVMLGSIKATAKHCEIPEQTVRNWSKTQWWKQAINEARSRHQSYLDGKFTYLIDKASKEISDRLEHGDEVVTAKGEVLRKKVTMRDAGDVLQKLMQQRHLMRGEPTARTERREVEVIEDKLAEFAKAKKEVQSQEENEETVH